MSYEFEKIVLNIQVGALSYMSTHQCAQIHTVNSYLLNIICSQRYSGDRARMKMHKSAMIVPSKKEGSV